MAPGEVVNVELGEVLCAGSISNRECRRRSRRLSASQSPSPRPTGMSELILRRRGALSPDRGTPQTATRKACHAARRAPRRSEHHSSAPTAGCSITSQLDPKRELATARKACRVPGRARPPPDEPTERLGTFTTVPRHPAAPGPPWRAKSDFDTLSLPGRLQDPARARFAVGRGGARHAEHVGPGEHAERPVATGARS